ncbi:amidohydrolase family protein [Paenibacillus dendritiformis]|uniref:amidohydrolase n=1 Tax=Paenibacillus dendritiformis TaxID=130049 RepID=UPI00143D2155|nr:amidohydrolase [Paenibacillus dendritiformis]NKI23514.1 amidohydrolase family protein [Paenibacillus dendritiformis]NRG00481.1 amidohydrolase family protein [Paenibacillus dendritiformis]
MYSEYWLTHVRLETGYTKEDGRITGTSTSLFHIRVKDGMMGEIRPAASLPADPLPRIDAQGLLLLPPFREMHIHLDKTYYGGPWKAVRPVSSIFERIEEERRLLVEQAPYVRERAAQILDLILRNGSTHIRAHVNIDPVSELHNLEKCLEVLEAYRGMLTYEIVAFTQHGLLRSNAAGLLRQAARSGAGLIGSVDPHSVDGNRKESLATLMDIAVETNTGIDIHVHDGGEPGLATLHHLADLTEDAGWQGRVAVSHSFAFASASAEQAAELADRFAALGIAVHSTVPIGRRVMPLPMMKERGVPVGLGTDSLTDHWSPFGTGDMLEKAGRLAELYGYSDELGLSQALGFITGGITPLSLDGQQVWPAPGLPAGGVLVQASCSAEAVARKSIRQAVLHEGRIVAGSL